MKEREASRVSPRLLVLVTGRMVVPYIRMRKTGVEYDIWWKNLNPTLITEFEMTEPSEKLIKQLEFREENLGSIKLGSKANKWYLNSWSVSVHLDKVQVERKKERAWEGLPRNSSVER